MVTKKERSRTLFKGIIKSKKTSAAQKTAARKNLAKLGGSSKKRGNPRRGNTLKQVGQFFGVGKKLGRKAAQTKFVKNAIMMPGQAAVAGAGYAVFEAVTLPLALSLKSSRLNVPVAASQAIGAWLLAISPNRAMKAVGLQGIGIETYSAVQKLNALKTLREQSSQLLGRILPAQNGGQ